MTLLTDLAAAMQDLAGRVQALALDPADAIRLLIPLASYHPAEAVAQDALGTAMAQVEAASSALGRRAALAALARAAAAAEPPSYEEAIALRDRICGLLDAEMVVASDAGADRSANALRGLRAALARRLSEKAGNLPRLRTVEAVTAQPALVHAYRLYEDLERADEVAAYAAAEDPNFIGGTFRVRGD
ncbi:hypothetical protein [Roseomonas xinghualingensis]|uniref:hypothetical protein n=1 Tax=Roseomonas xinghualingensis TaxID=2986475 RepID=UPI0021F1661F|nr:hypothetical protein [Roseomonas sp. SXEYE001]MCV4206924.1 hypothetical protein [Roseomonas sp. SXEYE001]